MRRFFQMLAVFLAMCAVFAQQPVIPAAKRPRPVDREKAAAAAAKDEYSEDEEKFRNTIQYGIPSEISSLLDDLVKNEDPRFTDEIYDLFQKTKNMTIREKVLVYFTKLEDPCVEDYAVEVLIDPVDIKTEVVKAAFGYVSAVKTQEAVAPVLTLIENENESYFNDAIATLGEIGGPDEAMYLVEFLDREDLSDAQRQTLMRTCGKMHAVETWDKIVEVLNDTDENMFVRMYAAEALGLMKKKESVEILCEKFSESDPNLRQYVIKGLANFPDDDDATDTIVQGIRDEHWKVRQESIRAAKELDLKESVPYLIYRAKNDSENVIKNEAYAAIAKMNTNEGNDFLVGCITDKKSGDSAIKKAAEVLLKEGNTGAKEVAELAVTVADDDRRKDLRYALGKEIAKYSDSAFAPVCAKYLSSKDSQTVSLGLDMYKTGKYGSAEGLMRALYDDKKTASGVKTRIQKLLDIAD